MAKNIYKITNKVWVYPGVAGWHFVSVPKKQSQNITKTFGAIKHGWGSLPVTATLGQSSWETSIFPDSKTGTYLLPLKASIRKKEQVSAGQTIEFLLIIKV